MCFAETSASDRLRAARFGWEGAAFGGKGFFRRSKFLIESGQVAAFARAAAQGFVIMKAEAAGDFGDVGDDGAEKG